MKSKERAPGLDLIRCLAMLFVVIFHAFLNNSYYAYRQQGIAMWLAGSFRWITVSCIGLFIILTGYLQCEKTNVRHCYRSLVSVLISYLIACMISIPIEHFVFNEARSILSWAKLVVQFGGITYGWYVIMYICLMMLAPFINVMLKHLSNKGLILLSAALLILTALPGSIPWPVFSAYWRGLYPLSYYVLGALVRRLQPKIPAWISIGCAVAMAFALGTITILSTNSNFPKAAQWEFQDLWIVFIAVCLFVGLYRIRIPARLHKVLTFGAGGCFGACLISHLFDRWCYKLLPALNKPDRYFLQILCISIPIYLVTIVLGHFLQKFVNLIMKTLNKILNLLPTEELDKEEQTIQ